MIEHQCTSLQGVMINVFTFIQSLGHQQTQLHWCQYITLLCSVGILMSYCLNMSQFLATAQSEVLFLILRINLGWQRHEMDVSMGSNCSEALYQWGIWHQSHSRIQAFQQETYLVPQLYIQKLFQVCFEALHLSLTKTLTILRKNQQQSTYSNDIVCYSLPARVRSHSHYCQDHLRFVNAK